MARQGIDSSKTAQSCRSLFNQVRAQESCLHPGVGDIFDLIHPERATIFVKEKGPAFEGRTFLGGKIFYLYW